MSSSFQAKQPPQNRPVAGALYVTASGVMFSVMGALIKIASVTMSNEMIVFCRNIVVLSIMLPFLLANRRKYSMKTENFHLHLIRSLAGLSAMYCYFYALSRMQLAEAVLLSYTSPLFIPLVALLWLKEPVYRRVIYAVAIGFTGVVLIMKPGSGLFQPVAFIGLTAGAFASVAMVSIRRLSASEPPLRIVFYYTLVATVISAVPLIWTWRTPDVRVLGILAAIGVVALCGQMFVTKGYSLAPSARVGPFTYSTVFFAAVFGWMFWNESFDLLTGVGAVLICAAGIMATRR